MSLSNAAETALLTLLFPNTAWANIGDATGLRGSSTAGVFYIGLHTADPGEAGTQSTSEASYTGYARMSVARSSSGFTVTNDTVTNVSAVTFGTRTDSGAAQAITYFSIGTDASGTGNLIMSGAISVAGGGTSLSVTQGVAPSFAAGQLSATAA